MHSHYGTRTTQDVGFQVWKWSILLIAAYSSSWFLSTTTLSHPYLHLLLVLQQTAAHTTRMVLAVARATARKAANAITHHGGHHGPGQSVVHRVHGGTQARHASTAAPSIHGPGPCPPKPSRYPSHKLFTQSRNFLTRIFNHLTAPGLRVPTHIHNGGAGAARSLHSGATPTIRSGLSFHARVALSSGPRHNIFLPRPPSPGVRVATNVGLGTARNFSTARPIFQNLVNNIPVAGRAFYEADLDLRSGRVRQTRPRRGKKSSTQGKTKEMLQPRNSVIEIIPQERPEDEIAQYFRNTVAPVTTYLFVPLAPTPSSRVPLPVDPAVSSNSPSLLPPLSYIGPHHASYEMHATRVSSLFSRLNQADVWAKGVKCSHYGQGSNGVGVCTVLRVEFVGWTEREVRAVIGEGGTGWCALEEVWLDEVDNMTEFSSAVDPAELAGTKNPGPPDPTSSFIMPTLDLSSSMLDASLPASPSMESVSLPSSRFSSRPISPIPDDVLAWAMEPEYDDPWSDVGSDAEARLNESVVVPPSENGWTNAGSARSWQNLDASRTGNQHLNQWD